MMFPRLVVWWLCILRVSSLKGYKKAFQSGDIILGGLNVLHYKDAQDRCGGFFPVGVGHTEAMIFAIEEINNDALLLPNTSLGFDIRDYCETISIAVKETYEFVRDTELYHSCSSNNSGVDNETNSCCFLSKDSTPVALIIGPYDSASAVQIGSLLSMAEIPIISFAATSDELSSAQFRYFLRTVPSDSQQVRVQADLFEHFQWTYVGTVALDDSYGRFGVSALQSESYKRNTFCVAFSEFIPRLRAAQSMTQIVSRIKQQGNVKVVVVWVFGGYAKQFFEEAHRQKLSQRTWILGDATSMEGSELLGPYFRLLDGALGVQPHNRKYERFAKHLASITPNKTSFGRNPWWAEYWEQFRNCSVQTVNETDPKCIDVPLSRNEANELFDPYLVYLIDAIYAAAYALDRSIRCRDSEEKFRGPGECLPANPSKTGRIDLLSYLKNVSFKGLTGMVEFDNQGNPRESSFEIVNIQVRGAGEKNKFVVGSWNSKEQQRLRLNDSAIKWANGSIFTEVPSSVCSEVCAPGTRQEIIAPCCWKCVKCPGGTVSKEPGSTNCTACSPNQKSNDAKTKCLSLPVRNLRFQDTAGVCLSFVTVVGYCVTTVALLVFMKFRKTAIVKASNRQLSFVLLLTIFLSFTLALLRLAEPTDFICRVTLFSRYIIYTTFVSILWLKSVRIFVVFQVDASMMPWQEYISKGKYQVALVALVNSVDVVMLTAWFASDPPFRNEKIQPTQYIFYTCKPYGFSVGKVLYFMVCSYVLLLSLLSSAYAFKVRKLPDNFNEARFIGFSLYIILLSALCYYSLEFSVQEGWYISVIACTTTLVDSFGLLGCMFGPKVFNILFHPERNSKEVVRSQITAYVWQNNQLTNLDSNKPTASLGSEEK